MQRVKITQIKSTIGASKKQKATMDALGLRKVNHFVEHNSTPSMKGMLKRVSHLIKIG